MVADKVSENLKGGSGEKQEAGVREKIKSQRKPIFSPDFFLHFFFIVVKYVSHSICHLTHF